MGGRGCNEIPGLIACMLHNMVCLSALFANLGSLFVSFREQYQPEGQDEYVKNNRVGSSWPITIKLPVFLEVEKLSRGGFLDLVHEGFSGDACGRSYQKQLQRFLVLLKQ